MTNAYENGARLGLYENNAECLDTIEGMLDRMGVETFLRQVAVVCDAKAAHLAENWQDHAAANWWCKVSRRLEALALRCRALANEPRTR